ncbi:hypothetical protein Cch01nite_22640 [Cellulomonas chitinilytica]|uniref:DUF1345 domain-containing protein n=1 Tax=Cellulomonas chitinilytica TaxID=398759 RepID=A0A919P3F1_9CELL|nr:DUF1345 domain-containing protein [Cellulomonas chitinilytica]GIG21540.1 hypothetical protein Cch01nite_22640 [Cellulomonas chitinilytica]
MTATSSPRRRTRDVVPLARLGIGVVIGVAVALVVVWTSLVVAVLAGWATTAVLFVVSTWAVVGPMDSAQTSAHATREEPTRTGAHLVVVVGALVSLAGVTVVLVGPDDGDALPTLAVVASVVASWAAIHTVFALRYARMFFGGTPGGIDFHQDEPPRYTDFAYVAVTIGMSFAISDTDLESSAFRRAALAHAMLSYLFGTVIIALVVTLVGGL